MLYLKRSYFLVISLLFLTVSAQAQKCQGGVSEWLDANQVHAKFWNSGDMFWDIISQPSFIVPFDSNKANHRSSMFANALWMGGLDQNNQLHVAGQNYRQSGNDYFPGPFRTTGNYECDSVLPFQKQPDSDLFLTHTKTGKVLLFDQNGFEHYDPTTGAYFTDTFPASNLFVQVHELADHRILIFGDDIFSVPKPTLLLDSNLSSVQSSIALNNLHHQSAAVNLPSGKVLLTGRYGSEIYDPVANTSQTINSPSAPTLRHQSILLPNGKVFLCGGQNTSLPNGAGIDSTYLFDLQTLSWTSGPKMLVGRSGHDLVLASNGLVYVFGGNSSNDSVEVYDPVSNTISFAGELNAYPNSVTKAFELPTGKFWIGLNGKSVIWDPNTNTTEPKRGDDNLALTQNGKIILHDFQGFLEYDIATDKINWAKWQNIWKVTQDQINQFISDYQNGTINYSKYPAIEKWPAKGKVAYGEDAIMAPFTDVNNDGIYYPTRDGDYPCIVGDQELWWVFNDAANPHTETGGMPLEVQVKASAHAWDCQTTSCPDSSIDQTIFLHYELVNKSSNDYHDYYFGYWADVDLGNYSDDYVGCDSTLELGYAYNADNDDEGAAGYGLNPPAIGTMFLNAPMTNFIYYENDFSARGNPSKPSDYYGYLKSQWKDSTHLVNNGQNGYPGTSPGPLTNFMYPGDAGFCGGNPSGWTEVSAMNQPYDRRYLMSSGPYDFKSGDTLVFDLAIIWQRGSSNLNSVCELKSAASAVKSFWNSQNQGCFNLTIDREEEQDKNEGIRLYPNPARASFSVSMDQAISGRASVQVLDLFGNTIKKLDWIETGTTQTFNVSELPTGIYFVRVVDGSKEWIEKLVLIK